MTSECPRKSDARQVSYGYDAADHPTSLALPAVGGLAAETVTTSYDSLGYPDTLAGAATYIDNSSVDARGRPVGRASGSLGATTATWAWSYDADQRLKTTTASVAGFVVQDDQYYYDLVGNVRAVRDWRPGVDQKECFAHDARHRLAAAHTVGAAKLCDDPHSAGGEGPAPYDHAYSYSVDGNLTSGPAGAYGYPAAGQARPHAPTSVGADSYSWDPNGALDAKTVDGVAWDYGWDPEHRLATATSDPGGPAEATTTMVYDADGTRLIRRDAQSATLYLDGHEITATSGGVDATRYYDFAGDTIAVRTPAGVSVLAGNHQASIEAAAGDPGGQLRSYLPYGDYRTGTDTPGQRGFLGQTDDTDLGLAFLNNRHYDPAIGRFISPDPLMDTSRPQTINPYTYGLNNPVTHSDPSGLIADDCVRTGAHCSGNGDGTWNLTTPPMTGPGSGLTGGGGGGGGGHLESDASGGGPPVQVGIGPGQVTTTAQPPSCRPCATSPGPSSWDLAIGLGKLLFFDPEECDDSVSWSCSLQVLGMVPAGKFGKFGRFLRGADNAPRVADDFVDLASPARRRHILDGEVRPNGTFGGGHRAGTGFPGKTEFPADWSDDLIMHHVSDVATDPASSVVHQQGRDVFVRGVRDGREVEVLIRNGEIWTAYPIP